MTDAGVYEMLNFNNVNANYSDLPFVSGIVLQQYHVAEEGILAASKNRCSHWYIDGSLPTDFIDGWSEERINNLKKMIIKYGVSPIFHGNFKVPLASDVEQLRIAAVNYTKAEIDICHKLSASLILHGGAIVEPRLIIKAKQEALKNYLLSLKELAEYAGEKNVTIHLENLSNYKNYRPFHYIFTHMDEFDFIFDQIKQFSNVDFFLDIGHANICEGEPLQILRKYHSIIKGMSFSNNDGEKDQHFGINSGTINYQEIMAEIIKCNWHGIVVFETRGKTIDQSIADLALIYGEVINIKVCS